MIHPAFLFYLIENTTPHYCLLSPTTVLVHYRSQYIFHTILCAYPRGKLVLFESGPQAYHRL